MALGIGIDFLTYVRAAGKWSIVKTCPDEFFEKRKGATQSPRCSVRTTSFMMGAPERVLPGRHVPAL